MKIFLVLLFFCQHSAVGQNLDSIPGEQMDEKECKSVYSCSAALDLSRSLFCPSLSHSNFGGISMSHKQLLQHLGKVPYLRVFMVWQLAAMESKEIFLQRECWQAALLWEQLHIDSDLYGTLKINHKWKVENNVPFLLCWEGLEQGGTWWGYSSLPLPGLTACSCSWCYYKEGLGCTGVVIVSNQLTGELLRKMVFLETFFWVLMLLFHTCEAGKQLLLSFGQIWPLHFLVTI